MKNVWVGYVVPGSDDVADIVERRLQGRRGGGQRRRWVILLMLLAGAGRCLIRPRSVSGVPAPKKILGINAKLSVLLTFPTAAFLFFSWTTLLSVCVCVYVYVEAPLIWHLGFNESEEIQEIDYVEAEVESTDTVEPHLDELFGEKLLIAKFCLADTLNKPPSHSNMAITGSDEITVPPGTVFNKHAKRHTSVILRNIGKNTSKTQQSLQSATVKMDGDDSSKRPDSVSSQQTFVLENSRRRPLVARDPFKIGFVFK
ncbi:unnamed protein product [Acanthocheilonema viteae]|uniref:Uncharacterized protein n=1 Tax=Acanthocheilonema viteae TaxID=6277 RepID=A0A498SI88_ACAVI|nr:unnamed protein product [Acanthocheilonema viteae]